MSGDIVNLRQIRKSKKRTEAEMTAAANRASFGRTRDERRRQEMEADRARRVLDGARREAAPDDGG